MKFHLCEVDLRIYSQTPVDVGEQVGKNCLVATERTESSDAPG